MDIQHKILIVEDETALGEALVDKFQLEGFITFSAIDGAEGLTLAFKEHPEIILLDVAMPKMDGIEMLKQMRQDEWGKNIKVIILSNFSDQEKITKAVEHGVYEYLIKSDWKLEDIVKKVKQKIK